MWYLHVTALDDSPSVPIVSQLVLWLTFGTMRKCDASSSSALISLEIAVALGTYLHKLCSNGWKLKMSAQVNGDLNQN